MSSFENNSAASTDTGHKELAHNIQEEVGKLLQDPAYSKSPDGTKINDYAFQLGQNKALQDAVKNDLAAMEKANKDLPKITVNGDEIVADSKFHASVDNGKLVFQKQEIQAKGKFTGPPELFKITYEPI